MKDDTAAHVAPSRDILNRRSLLGAAGVGVASAMATSAAAQADPGPTQSAPPTTTGGTGFLPGHRARLGFVKGVLQQDEKRCFGMALGDSITEGLGLNNWKARYQTQLQTLLRSAHPAANTTPGIGYIPAVWGGQGWMQNGTTTNGTPVDGQTGLANRLVELKKGQEVTWPATPCDTIWVHYSTGPKWPGPFEVLINQHHVAAQDSGADTVASGEVLELHPKGRERKSLTVRATGGTCRIEGATFLNGQGGLYLVDASHSGYRADLYINSDRATWHWQAAQHFDAAFFTCMLGANDMAGNFNIPITPQEWAANLADLVDAALTACPEAGFYFFHWTERYEDVGTNKLRDFQQAARDAIGGHPRVSFHLLSDLLPSGHDDSLKWHGQNGQDHVHPNKFGHTYLAREMSRVF